MRGCAHEHDALTMGPRGWRLYFRHRCTEAAFRRDYAARIRIQAQVAMITGALAYLVLGVEDPWFFPQHFPTVWLLRLAAVSVIAVGLVLSLSRWWWKLDQPIIASVALLAGCGPLLMLAMGSAEVARSYYFGLALVMVWTHTFSGLRVAGSVAVSVVLFAGYVGTVLGATNLASHHLATSTLNLATATSIAAVAGYVIERQRRLVFAQTRLLEAERSSHREQALRDHLTGLPNRIRFEADAEKARARARRHQHYMAVLFIDIDGFKRINDDLGHHAGDHVLATVSRGLERAVRTSDTVARMGGDEFLVLLEDLPDAGEASRVAEALIDSVKAPIAVQNGTNTTRLLRVTASIGVAVNDGYSPLELQIRKADDAMYAAKAAGPGEFQAVGPTGESRPATSPTDGPAASGA